MEILRTLAVYTEDKDLRFLVVGGHAVSAYGVSRQTGDIDLLVQGSRADQWRATFAKLDYRAGQNDTRFIRFQSLHIAAWPVDLMLVDDATFEAMYSQSQLMDIGVARVRVVSPRHLVTLKLHALKHYQEHRYAKDFTDVLQLLRSGRVVFSAPELRALCERYADVTLYDKLQAELGSILL